MFSDTLDRPQTEPRSDVLNDYVGRRLFSLQWRAFAKSLATELFGNFPREDAWGFLRQIGRRMAEELPIGRLETLPELEAAINGILDDISWGVTRIGLSGQDIIVTHSAFPNLASDDPAQEHWRDAGEALLEGLYSAWFESQGAAPNMRTEVEKSGDPQTIQLRIGY